MNQVKGAESGNGVEKPVARTWLTSHQRGGHLFNAKSLKSWCTRQESTPTFFNPLKLLIFLAGSFWAEQGIVTA